ncbi:MAG: ABC transporter permease [Coriobacteriales bacterium]|jgi:ABC-type nitrate/sulfonate/bicarbonate transport system permease component
MSSDATDAAQAARARAATSGGTSPVGGEAPRPREGDRGRKRAEGAAAPRRHGAPSGRGRGMGGARRVAGALLGAGALAWAALLVAWVLGARAMGPDFLPSPLATVQGAADLIERGTLQEDVAVSLVRVLKGWLGGLVVAIPLGLAIGNFRGVATVLEPLINFFRFVPAIGFLTLFLLWFGVGEQSKVALIFYATIFPVTINTIAGVRQVDPALVEASQTLGASRARTFFTVVVPAAVPNMFTGVRLGLSGAITAIVAAEMLAASSGLGYLIYTSRLYYHIDWIFVGIFTLGVIGFLADRLLQWAGRRLLLRFGVK